MAAGTRTALYGFPLGDEPRSQTTAANMTGASQHGVSSVMGHQLNDMQLSEGGVVPMLQDSASVVG